MTSLVALTQKLNPKTVQPPPIDQICAALMRYQLVDDVPFLMRWLSHPLESKAALIWQRRRWVFIIRTMTCYNNTNDIIATSIIGRLPKDIFRLIVYLL